MALMSKSERAELRSVTRQQFKVLRDEVRQREKELLATIEAEMADRYREQDKARADVGFVLGQIALEANRKANDLLREHADATGGEPAPDGHDFNLFHQPKIRWPENDRYSLREQAHRELTARVSGAVARLNRQEADLLRELALDAIESEEAHRFLANIPSVSELVPATRLAALEASLGDDD